MFHQINSNVVGTVGRANNGDIFAGKFCATDIGA